jgi:hypothetical protein
LLADAEKHNVPLWPVPPMFIMATLLRVTRMLAF